jgi:hypothetical protein
MSPVWTSSSVSEPSSFRSAATKSTTYGRC